MKAGRVGAALAVLGLVAGGCVDYDAGPEILTGRAAIHVGLDMVARGLAGSPAGEPATVALDGGAVSAIRLVVGNLPPLGEAAAYQVWLVDQAGGQEPRRTPVVYQRQMPDTVGYDPFTDEPIIEWNPVGEPQVGAQSFAGVHGARHRVEVRAADVSGAALADYTHVVVTISATGEEASPMSSPAPAWYRFRNPDTGAYLASGPVRFGFRPQAGWMNTPWSSFGGGSIEFLNVHGFGLLARNIARPPLGFFYEAWLVDDERGGKAPLRVGVLTSPAPHFEPLDNADQVIIPDLVTPTQLVRAARWAEWAELGARFDDYTNVVVVLRSKHHGPGDVMPPAVIYDAMIPPQLDRLPIERERRMHDTR